MKRIAIAILAGGLSLSALTLGSKAADAAEPCAPQVVQTAPVRPAAYGYGDGYYGRGAYGERARELRVREHLRIEREQARRRWMFEHRYSRY
jgi:hypothetical protein